MKRLLCIISCMNTGGAETFLMKIYRSLDKTKYQMDFCVNSQNNFYEKEIIENGGKIYIIPPKSNNPIKSFLSIKSIVKNNKYRYVIRVNEHSLSTLDLLAAKLGGAKILSMRSSNASSSNKKSIFLHKLFKFMPKMIPNAKLAPSKLAAEYTFGNKCIENHKAYLLNNGLNVKQFTFSEEKRKEKRGELNIENKIVIGHIGRFNAQKNHEFLIDIFNEIHKKKLNSILVLVGQGDLENKIKEKVNRLKLENNVLFLGVREDIPDLLCAFDFFLFPSFYEGMPNTVIEAQTTGLPCLISDSITQEAKITDKVNYASLNETALIWSNKCLNLLSQNSFNRKEYSIIMKNKGYEMSDCVKKFVELVFNERNNTK